VYQKVYGGGNVELERRVVERYRAAVTAITTGEPTRIEISLPEFFGKIVIPPEVEADIASLGKPLDEYRQHHDNRSQEYYHGADRAAIEYEGSKPVCRWITVNHSSNGMYSTPLAA